MLDDNTADALARAFVLGTGRTPAPVAQALPLLANNPQAELQALALVGQRLRFRRLVPAETLDPPPAAVSDPRQEIPQAARPLLRRLITAKTGVVDAAALAIADAMARNRLRLHAFDLPRFDSFVRRHAERLGTAAIAWVARTTQEAETAETGNDYFEPETLNESNWHRATPFAGATFIRGLRASQPDHARALVEAAMAAKPAPARLRLVNALVVGLSAADLPFLDSLKADRAPTVRDAAQALLARIPGTEAAQKDARELAARIKVTTNKAGGKVLAFNFSAVTRHHHAQLGEWAIANIPAVDLASLARELGLSVADMLAGAAGDVAMATLFARQYSFEGRYERLADIVRKGDAEDAWEPIVAGAASVEGGAEWATPAWAEAALAPERWGQMPQAHRLTALYQVLRAPLPAATALTILISNAWRDWEAKIAEGHVYAGYATELTTVLAALMPAAARSRFREALEPLPALETTRARSLLDCLDVLDPA